MVLSARLTGMLLRMAFQGHVFRPQDYSHCNWIMWLFPCGSLNLELKFSWKSFPMLDQSRSAESNTVVPAEHVVLDLENSIESWWILWKLSCTDGVNQSIISKSIWKGWMRRYLPSLLLHNSCGSTPSNVSSTQLMQQSRSLTEKHWSLRM